MGRMMVKFLFCKGGDKTIIILPRNLYLFDFTYNIKRN
jgi:hypothetical protein